NYLNKSEMEEIFNLLDKNKSIMSYTRTPKYVFLSKIIRILGLHITSRLWFVFSKWKSGIC
ncbi:MAG TPA: hypothetical protein DDY31_01120, partial [Lachnospiraceae bacterium]|nr:hypothetical protein [Lachnospiraceae bacterium]